jgi:hypothetical protein
MSKFDTPQNVSFEGGVTRRRMTVMGWIAVGPLLLGSLVEADVG